MKKIPPILTIFSLILLFLLWLSFITPGTNEYKNEIALLKARMFLIEQDVTNSSYSKYDDLVKEIACTHEVCQWLSDNYECIQKCVDSLSPNK